MGINGLGPYSRSECKGIEFELPLHYFSGTCWGIDALNWSFMTIPTSVKSILERRKNIFDPITDEELFAEVKKRVFGFNKKLLDHNITPVWIWDGESQDNKVQTQQARRDARKKTNEKHKIFEAELKEKDPMEIKPWEEKKWKNSVSVNTRLPFKYILKIKEMNKDFGIPTITSDDEAENLASSLSVEGKISLVWSTDTDNYPLGAARVGNKFSYKKGKIFVKGVEPRKIVSQLRMTFKEFRDFCILLGTDFNDRIKYVGPKTSFKLIKKYGCLEKIDEETDHNLTFMNYPFVRTQLTPYSTYYQINIHLSPKKDFTYEKVEELKINYDGLDIHDLLSSVNESRHVDFFSPMRMLGPPPTEEDEEDG